MIALGGFLGPSCSRGNLPRSQSNRLARQSALKDRYVQ